MPHIGNSRLSLMTRRRFSFAKEHTRKLPGLRQQCLQRHTSGASETVPLKEQAMAMARPRGKEL